MIKEADFKWISGSYSGLYVRVVPRITPVQREPPPGPVVKKAVEETVVDKPPVLAPHRDGSLSPKELNHIYM